ncbi:hypothetical protein F511_32035 [Dorcoceras hygrometricum]|uniref:Splicing factor 3B subunit 1-like n=1 Tax=Dorcoceras hygrometricum TaxID=472368 RepID=A0A2Z7D654_9LAMI|nr:hypothetical protein F511_32035 [Dorcoceras hygrometricum]
MAASLINNTIQVYFDSVFSMADEGMVKIFMALESSGLRGFLGCSSAIYEIALVDFYHNASMRDNRVISSIQGKIWCLMLGVLSLQTVNNLRPPARKREMEFEFRLLNYILAKTITVKAGSFDVVTHERFLMMAAIHGGVKINWGILLFNLLKDMVTPSSKQARGFAVLEVPVDKMIKKAATKRRPAPVVVEPAAKKKRTTVGRAAPAEKDLSIVPVVQNQEPISVVPIVIPRAQRRRASKRKLVLQSESDDETVENIIKQVLTETAEIEIDETESRIDVSSITNYDEDSSLKVLSNEEGSLVETEKEKEKENEKEKIIDSEDTEPLSKVLVRTETSTSDEESMSIDDLLAQIMKEMMLPSVTAAEPTKITFGTGIEIREKDWYKASLPQIDVADKGKAPLVEKDEIKGHSAREMFSLICVDIEFLVQIRDKFIEDISSFFSSFSLRRLEILETVSDIAAKEEQMLAWEETDSLQMAVVR